jgi:prepilin-type processing-associated H-X9-DG protein
MAQLKCLFGGGKEEQGYDHDPGFANAGLSASCSLVCSRRNVSKFDGHVRALVRTRSEFIAA